MKNRLLLSFVFIFAVAASCAPASHPKVTGIITQVELGKDGVQVALQAEDRLYSVTISELHTEIAGSFDQIVVGAEIEVSGEEIAGMDPPLIVADTVRILGSPNPLIGSMWVLVAYNDQQPIREYQPTLKFETDRFSGTTGCNHYGGNFQIKEKK
ncbi:MAG TPA: META domain-containing protein [Anaerolineales bacterium]|nr:META domain-containing protein [Anaerolineales bacterium]